MRKDNYLIFLSYTQKIKIEINQTNVTLNIKRKEYYDLLIDGNSVKIVIPE